MHRTSIGISVYQLFVIALAGAAAFACDKEDPPLTPEEQAFMDAAHERVLAAWEEVKKAESAPNAEEKLLKEMSDLADGQSGHGLLLKLDTSMAKTSLFSAQLLVCCINSSLSEEAETWVKGVTPDVTRANAAVEKSWELEGGTSGTPTAGNEEILAQHEKTVESLVKAVASLAVTLGELDERIPDESKSEPVRALLVETQEALDDLRAVLAARAEKLKLESRNAR